MKPTEQHAVPRTLFEKIWASHVVAELGDGWCLLHIDRQLLHASELTFADPATGLPHHFVAPLPDDFRHWLDRLGLGGSDASAGTRRPDGERPGGAAAALPG